MAKIEIVFLPQFEKELKRLLKKYPSLPDDFENLLTLLTENPFAGIRLGHNCYKVRMQIKSKNTGKSGGARVITCVRIMSSKLYLVSIFDKADRESISADDIIAILNKSGLQ
jgi:mRNA-degrading endonuclease RelE of RelBE toxin-antitoxin system